ncbi:hypothetical protein NG891_15055 [Enterococcus gallinarum]|uniref:hypothetical protein n=1 Tax=Enterococcus gallinarum TaxID=1353 RepID=UPI002090C7AB|nr:hypothetical protein [Enterococcus gallinarum]MCO5478065.1 hypothetical protein [Enterococcus gallinarum]
MSKEERHVECYILGQHNEHGMIEWLIDDVARDRCILESYLYQTGYLCEYLDGECWKYRLKTSNQINFCIRKIIIPAKNNKKPTLYK